MVIDAYLATSNIAIFLQKGVAKLLIVNENNYLLAKTQFPDSLLVGESLLPVKFDLSNSAAGIASVSLTNRTVLYMSINGTKALESVDHERCEKVFVASFLNLSATAQYLRKNFPEAKITIFAAGSEGKDVLEDSACARLLSDQLLGKSFDWPKIREEVRIFIQHHYGAWSEDINWALSLDQGPTVLESRVEGEFIHIEKLS